MTLIVEVSHDKVKIDKQYVFRPDHVAPSQWLKMWEAAIAAMRTIDGRR